MSAPLSKAEFISRAADAILRNMGYADPDSAPGSKVLIASADAQVALEAVGAWEMLRALDGFRWVGNNLHNIKDSPDAFRGFYEAALADAVAAIAKAEGRA